METEPTQPNDYISFYRRAFAEYRVHALWNMRMFDNPSPEAALVVARTLRIEGDRQARQLAEDIEKACFAAHLNQGVDNDCDDRFPPVMSDDAFGCDLDSANIAVNKLMAAVGRREVRDVVDVVTIHETILPLGAVIWAAVEKAPGFTPEGLIAELRRNMFHPLIAWQTLTATQPIDPKEMALRFRAILDEAEAFVLRMPTAKMGLLFLKDGKVVQPDPDHLENYQTHAGQRRGQWPSSPEITAAMLEHYNKSSQPEIKHPHPGH